MILNIVKEYSVVSDLNTMIISAEMLRSPATHLFLASNSWESVTVELCKELPEDVLEYVPILSDNVRVKLPETIDDKMLKALISIFPDRRGAIRRVYMSKGDMSEVVPVCTEK